MSTSGAIRANGSGTTAGRPGGSWAHVAGRPRRARERRRAVLLLVATLAVLTPIGLQIHGFTSAHATDVGQLTVGNAVPGQRGQPPEPGSITPALARAVDRARTAAQEAGLDLQVTSGFRSAATQQRLYDDAIAKYGSAQIARRWVLPPAESDHVKGLAVDVGPRPAAAWLEKNGVRFGLCRRYVNEWWHFERLAPAIGQQCPALEPYAGG